MMGQQLRDIDNHGKTLNDFKEYIDTRILSINDEINMDNDRFQNEILGGTKYLIGCELPSKIQSTMSYAWTESGDSIKFKNPVDSHKRITSIASIEAVRITPLIIISKIRLSDSKVEILFEKHKDWGWILPYTEIPTKKNDYRSILAASKLLIREGLGLDKNNICLIKAGGILSFKKSAHNHHDHCYIFPLIIARITIVNREDDEYSFRGVSYRYLTKDELEKYEKIYANANGDVYCALARLFPRWHSLGAYAFEYDIAFSYAGEQRELVDKLVMAIAKIRSDIRMFYDKNENMTGRDLAQHFEKIFVSSSRYTVLIISKEYAKKKWTSWEKTHILSRQIQQNGEQYLFLLRTDDTTLSGIPRTLHYDEISNTSITTIAKKIAEKIPKRQY